jgi:hypothetical protein
MYTCTVLPCYFLCIAVPGGELSVNRTGSADTNKKLFEQKHDRQRQAPPANAMAANATASANITSAKAALAKAANATSPRDNGGQKVLPRTAQAAPADECLLKAACLYGVGHRRRDDGKKNEIRASEKVEKRVFFNNSLMLSER